MARADRRKSNITLIADYLYRRSAMPYSILFHAEDIAEETLCDVVYLNDIPIYSSSNNCPEYIYNRRTLLRSIRRRTELKPHKIAYKGKRVILTNG